MKKLILALLLWSVVPAHADNGFFYCYNGDKQTNISLLQGIVAELQQGNVVEVMSPCAVTSVDSGMQLICSDRNNATIRREYVLNEKTLSLSVVSVDANNQAISAVVTYTDPCSTSPRPEVHVAPGTAAPTTAR